MKINHNYKYIFVHIPKNAGNAMTASIPGLEHQSIGLPHWHCTYMEIINTNEQFKDYFSFAFVRNPFDRLYSLYQYNLPFVPRYKSRPDYFKLGLNWYDTAPFKEWLLERETWAGWDTNKQRLPEQRANQYPYITDNNGKIMVTKLGRFENITDDFNVIMKEIGINANLIKRNSSRREKDYMKMYDNEMKDFVIKHHKKDFELFGYEQ